MDETVEIGKIKRAAGLKGRFLIASYLESPEILHGVERIRIEKPDGRSSWHAVGYVNWSKKSIALEVEGIGNREEAEALVGSRVGVPSDLLGDPPEGEYYWKDLLGMAVFSESGERLGTIGRVFRTGSNDVFVCTGGPREILLPAIEDVIRQVDIPGKAMVVRLLEGL